jgi:hypothetical protein
MVGTRPVSGVRDDFAPPPLGRVLFEPARRLLPRARGGLLALRGRSSIHERVDLELREERLDPGLVLVDEREQRVAAPAMCLDAAGRRAVAAVSAGER